MLTIDQVVQADVVDRVGCPTCAQRRWVDSECHCCGGMGYVDCDDIFDVLKETLEDCCFIERKAPDWLVVGYYVVVGGAYIVLPNGNVDFVTDEQAEMAYRVSEAARRPGVFARFLSWVLPKVLRGVA
jgi:hypothetical protein